MVGTTLIASVLDLDVTAVFVHFRAACGDRDYPARGVLSEQGPLGPR